MFEQKELSSNRKDQLAKDLTAFLHEPDGSGERVIAEIIPQVNPEKHQMFVAPLASGKTMALAPNLLLGNDHYAPKRVIVVEPTQGLCADAHRNLSSLYGEDIIGHKYGGFEDDRVKNPTAPILVTTTGSFWNMLKHGNIEADDYVLFDEIHQGLAFAHTEASIALLSKMKNEGKRHAGMGYATGTFDATEKNGSTFLSWTGAELTQAKSESKYHRDLVCNPDDHRYIIDKLLSDPEQSGRNLLVLCTTNQNVRETFEWLKTQSDKYDEQIVPLLFSRFEGAANFEDNLRAALKNQLKNPDVKSRIVVVATYGLAGSGVNLPVHDVVGQGLYYGPVYEESKNSSDIKRMPVRGSILLQAMGRIGRFCDGSMYICDTNEISFNREYAYKPDPLPKPLNSSEGRIEIVFELLNIGVDPLSIPIWYSDIDKEKIAALVKSLTDLGLVTKDGLNPLAKQIAKNPLTSDSLAWALAVETAPQEIQASLQYTFALAGVDWRSLFPNELIRGSEKKSVSDLLIEKKLLRKTDNGILKMPDSDITLPNSDAALVYNVFEYMRKNNIRPQAVGMSDKMFYVLRDGLRRANTYLQTKRIDFNGYLSEDIWRKITNQIIKSNACEFLHILQRGGNHISEGIISGKLGYQRSDFWIASLKPHTVGGSDRRGRDTQTVFSDATLCIVPETDVPWLPDNVDNALYSIKSAIKSMFTHWNKEGIEKSPQETIQLIESLDKYGEQINWFADRDLTVSRFNFDQWFDSHLKSYLVNSRTSDIEELNEVLIELQYKNISIIPNINSVITPEKQLDIRAYSPESVSVSTMVDGIPTVISLKIIYKQGSGYIQLPNEKIKYDPVTGFDFQSHPLFSLTEGQLKETIGSLPLLDRNRRYGYPLQLGDRNYFPSDFTPTSYQPIPKPHLQSVYELGLSELANTYEPNVFLDYGQKMEKKTLREMLSSIQIIPVGLFHESPLNLIRYPENIKGIWVLSTVGVHPYVYNENNFQGLLKKEYDVGNSLINLIRNHITSIFQPEITQFYEQYKRIKSVFDTNNIDDIYYAEKYIEQMVETLLVEQAQLFGTDSKTGEFKSMSFEILENAFNALISSQEKSIGALERVQKIKQALPGLSQNDTDTKRSVYEDLKQLMIYGVSPEIWETRLTCYEELIKSLSPEILGDQTAKYEIIIAPDSQKNGTLSLAHIAATRAYEAQNQRSSQKNIYKYYSDFITSATLIYHSSDTAIPDIKFPVNVAFTITSNELKIPEISPNSWYWAEIQKKYFSELINIKPANTVEDFQPKKILEIDFGFDSDYSRTSVWIIDPKGKILFNQKGGGIKQLLAPASVLILKHQTSDQGWEKSETWEVVSRPPVITDTQTVTTESLSSTTHTHFSGSDTGWNLQINKPVIYSSLPKKKEPAIRTYTTSDYEYRPPKIKPSGNIYSDGGPDLSDTKNKQLIKYHKQLDELNSELTGTDMSWEYDKEAYEQAETDALTRLDSESGKHDIKDGDVVEVEFHEEMSQGKSQLVSDLIFDEPSGKWVKFVIDPFQKIIPEPGSKRLVKIRNKNSQQTHLFNFLTTNPEGKLGRGGRNVTVYGYYVKPVYNENDYLKKITELKEEIKKIETDIQKLDSTIFQIKGTSEYPVSGDMEISEDSISKDNGTSMGDAFRKAGLI
jgi:hypothetical protein